MSSPIIAPSLKSHFQASLAVTTTSYMHSSPTQAILSPQWAIIPLVLWLFHDQSSTTPLYRRVLILVVQNCWTNPLKSSAPLSHGHNHWRNPWPCLNPMIPGLGACTWAVEHCWGKSDHWAAWIFLKFVINHIRGMFHRAWQSYYAYLVNLLSFSPKLFFFSPQDLSTSFHHHSHFYVSLRKYVPPNENHLILLPPSASVCPHLHLFGPGQQRPHQEAWIFEGPGWGCIPLHRARRLAKGTCPPTACDLLAI